MTLKLGVIQTCCSDRPNENLKIVLDQIHAAAKKGAKFIVTPEVTNCVSSDRAHQGRVLRSQDEDLSLPAFCKCAADLNITLLIGSLALKSGSKFVNRSFLIGPDGKILAHYDKIHLFDVRVSETEHYKESDGYLAGNEAVLAQTDFGMVGMTVCYDLRFPHLFSDLAKAGAKIITVPSAFTVATGMAHWHVLLRARAIETGCFVVAPAQVGQHSSSGGQVRQTYGHSLVVSPWGEILLDAKTDVGISIVEIDLQDVDNARQRIPSLEHHRKYKRPT